MPVEPENVHIILATREWIKEILQFCVEPAQVLGSTPSWACMEDTLRRVRKSFEYWYHVNHCPSSRLTFTSGRTKPHKKALKVKLILESLPVEGDKEHAVWTYPILPATKKKKNSRGFYQYLDSHKIILKMSRMQYKVRHIQPILKAKDNQ